ncbi:MAG: SPOR domain-containing protein [Treponema sp.]|nr:SPOR domain-containing protein [Treponema sp.]
MRLKIIIIIGLALIAVSGLIAWEGAAATAPDGELPSTGRYIATNSFPRNTVVDITNIETNRSTRVIVANSLDSPGLLAIVSREAAELIGMRSGSISRIRMSQPSDPIAYLRFTESLAAGIHDFDSGNIITEENYQEEIERMETAVAASPPVRQETPPEITTGSGAPGYLLETEWGGRRMGIVDLPEYIVSGDPPHSALFDASEIVDNIPEETTVEEIAELIPEEQTVVEVAEHIPEEEVVEEIAELVPEEQTVVEVAEIIPEEEVVEEIAELIPEEQTIVEVAEHIPEEEAVEEIAELVPEEEAVIEIAELIPEEKTTDTPVTIESAGEAAQYNIVPAQERPPSPPGTIYGIDPSDIIPGITRISAVPARENAQPDAALSILMNEIEPIRHQPATQVNDTAAVVLMPEVEPIRQPSAAAAAASQIVLMPEVESVKQTQIQNTIPAVTSAPEEKKVVSYPSMSELNRGSYYVQIAAVDSPETAEKTKGMIDYHYGPVIYNDSGNLYRILLGPLNQGESAAVLQRFKSIGYMDAFVRHVR